MKRCVHCDTVRPSSEFRSMAGMRDGLDSWCRECHREYAQARYVPHPRVRQPRAPRKARVYIHKPSLLIGSVCVICAATFLASRAWSRYCSDVCRKASKHRHLASQERRLDPQSLTCGQCGTAFQGTRARRFCSSPCAIKYHRDADRDRRRAVSKGKPAERVFRRVVFQRDAWVCGVCYGFVDRHVEHPDPASPSLDHIVPLGRGGSHSYANVQLTHLGCNIRKGAHVAA